jgi:8-oxo-dGTP diphosphatase
MNANIEGYRQRTEDSRRQISHMVKLRLMATALLFNSRNELLMMKRSPYRTLSPGLWAAVGGHLEPEEIADPQAACLREIAEETGIEAHEINDLKLRYVLIRQNGNEIRQQFFYTGMIDMDPRIATSEGDLHWIPWVDVLERPMPFIFRALLEHYGEHGEEERAWTGTAGVDAYGGAKVHWVPLIDPFVT